MEQKEQVEPFSPDEFKMKMTVSLGEEPYSGFLPGDIPRLVATVHEVSSQGKFFKDVLRCICIASGKDIVCGKGAIKALTASHRLLVKDKGSMWIIRCQVERLKTISPFKP